MGRPRALRRGSGWGSGGRRGLGRAMAARAGQQQAKAEVPVRERGLVPRPGPRSARRSGLPFQEPPRRTRDAPRSADSADIGGLLPTAKVKRRGSTVRPSARAA
jgi:hypothetical protein